MRILIVDDELIICNGIQKILVDTKNPTWTILPWYTDSEEALEICNWDEVDLLLIDINMPGIDGLKLVEILRERGYETEVIIISGYSEFEYARQALRSNVLDFIVKPVDPSKLLEVVHTAQAIIQQKQEQRESHWYIEKNRWQLTYTFLSKLMFETMEMEPSLVTHYQHLLMLTNSRYMLAVFSTEKPAVTLESMVNACNKHLEQQQDRNFVSFLFLSASKVITLLMVVRDTTTFCQATLKELGALCSGKLYTEPLYTDDLFALSHLHDVLLLRLKRQEGKTDTFDDAGSSMVPSMQEGQYSLPVARVIEFVKEHYDTPLSLSILSDQVYVHPTYLSNLFRKETGFALVEYINRVRIEQAKILLMDPVSKIYWVAERVGFVNQRYFSQVFKHLVGFTPVQFRSNCFLANHQN